MDGLGSLDSFGADVFFASIQKDYPTQRFPDLINVFARCTILRAGRAILGYLGLNTDSKDVVEDGLALLWLSTKNYLRRDGDWKAAQGGPSLSPIFRSCHHCTGWPDGGART